MPRTVGIDLGTTNSVVSVLEGGEPVVIPNTKVREPHLPSSPSPRTAKSSSANQRNVRRSRTLNAPSVQ